MPIFPIPTTRTSDILLQSRLRSQMQADQLELLRLQTQISTGRRIQLPSEDAPAAARAATLQRLLEFKAQAKSNIASGQSLLDASDTAINSVSTLLIQARAAAIEAGDSTISETARNALIDQIQRSIETLVNTGNSQFRGRYLFAGSQSNSRPFTLEGDSVVYAGNREGVRTLSDVDQLFDASVSGDEVFGAISPQVRGTVDLNPILREDTPLTDLRGGQGIEAGSILVSDGSTSKIVDISSAATIGDVARLIEKNPPTGRSLKAHVEPSGLVLSLDDGLSGNLTIREVGAGTTAAELGILDPAGVGVGPLVGGDLNPRLRLTTKLADVAGARSRAYLDSAGANNDVVLEALSRGAQNNGVKVQYVDDTKLRASPGLAAGSEFATYSAVATPATAALTFSGLGNNLTLTAATPGAALNDVSIEVVSGGAIGDAANVAYNSATRKLTIAVDSTGATSVGAVVAAIGTEGTFSAAYDSSDPVDGGYNPTATIPPGDIGVVSGTTGNSGGDADTIFVHVRPGATTANQVVTAINANATIAARFVARVDGHDTSSPGFVGKGFVSIGKPATSSQGSGADLDQTSGLKIVNGLKSGVIDVSAATTVEDLLNQLVGAKLDLVAEINDAGTGVDVRSRVSGVDLSIGENGGTTATQLGVRSFTASTNLADLNHGQGIGAATTGPDFTITRPDGAQLPITIGAARTVQDVLDLINNDAANVGPNRVVARFASVGNGIELAATDPATPVPLTVAISGTSEAARGLGLVARGSASATGTTTAGQQTLSGVDVNPIEVQGVYTALIRLKQALISRDGVDVSRASRLLQDATERANFARGELGGRSQALDDVKAHLDDETIQLRSALSDEIDVDLTQAISELQARQASLQAVLQLSAKTFQLSLLNYL